MTNTPKELQIREVKLYRTQTKLEKPISDASYCLTKTSHSRSNICVPGWIESNIS